MQFTANMIRLLILTCCICAISASPVENVKRARRPRIIGGESIEIEAAPYQVAIIEYPSEDDDTFRSCGGTIISKNIVLTAAHCLRLEPEKYVIHAGSADIIQSGSFHKVVKIIKHDDYYLNGITGRTSHDIAIMKVEPEFELNGETERIIKLADEDDKVKPGADAYLTGWGQIDGGDMPEKLHGLSLKIMDFEECRNLYESYGIMSKYNICAQHPSGVKDMCRGDSGGPLVVNGKQVGIISWSGSRCAVPESPGVYTDVAHYRKWIDEHMDI